MCAPSALPAMAAPHGIAERIYSQATQTQMAVRYFKGEAVEKTLAWTERELEGFMRNRGRRLSPTRMPLSSLATPESCLAGAEGSWATLMPWLMTLSRRDPCFARDRRRHLPALRAGRNLISSLLLRVADGGGKAQPPGAWASSHFRARCSSRKILSGRLASARVANRWARSWLSGVEATIASGPMAPMVA